MPKYVFPPNPSVYQALSLYLHYYPEWLCDTTELAKNHTAARGLPARSHTDSEDSPRLQSRSSSLQQGHTEHNKRIRESAILRFPLKFLVHQFFITLTVSMAHLYMRLRRSRPKHPPNASATIYSRLCHLGFKPLNKLYRLIKLYSQLDKLRLAFVSIGIVNNWIPMVLTIDSYV